MPTKKRVSATIIVFFIVGCIGLIVFSGAAVYHSRQQRTAIAVVLATVPGGVIVLDDCDPDYDGKSAYEDNLTFMNAAGKITAQVSNLNICEEIGCPNRIAVDHDRGRVWVAETVTGRLLLFTLAGELVLSIPGQESSTLAVDPKTGNVWAATGSSIGKGSVLVYDDHGTCLATHEVHGYDITYDPVEESFWLVDTHLTKVDRDGAVLVQKPVTGWCAVSVSVSEKSGMVWAAVRRHSDQNGANELLCFDNNGNEIKRIALGNRVPFRVVMDAHLDDVWVVLKGYAMARYSSSGQLKTQHKLPAIAAAVERSTGNIWVMTYKETLKIEPDGNILCRTRNMCRGTYGWLAAY